MSTLQEFLSTIKAYTSCLGQGAFGIVLKGMDESDTSSAVKFLFPIDYSDREKLRREYKATESLQHENIVQILGVEEKKLTSSDIDKIFKDLPYHVRSSDLKAAYIERAKQHKTIESICIKMELCGSNLRSWLNQQHQQTELHVQIRQTRIIQGMIAGLKFLHSNNIIHRDLKPENIMFSRGRYQLPVKIGDFGHSRLIHSDHMTSNVGTQVYMAPEVSSGEYDHQADLYSLGLIIWEVAQLIEASKIKNLFDRLVCDREEGLVKDHTIMTRIKEIIIGLTKRKPAERTQSLNEVNMEAWEAALVHQVTRKECKPLWDAITTSSEKNWNVKTSEEFKLALDYASEGCTINLMDGEYYGGFVLWENGVGIVGMGAGTVLREVDIFHNDFLVVYGNKCTISDIKINLDNPLRKASPYWSSILLTGDMNMIKNVEINSAKEHTGIKINGSHNTVDNVILNNLQDFGIFVDSSSNANNISNITGFDLGRGIWVFGSNNTLSEIKLEKRILGYGGDGVDLSYASYNNTISKLTSYGYFLKEENDYDLKITASNTTVKDSKCGSVNVYLGWNTTLTNVDCGELIQIESTANCVNLMHCGGKQLQASDNVSVNDCQFEEILHNSQNENLEI